MRATIFLLSLLLLLSAADANAGNASALVDGAFNFVAGVARNGSYAPQFTGQDPFDVYSGLSGVAVFALEYAARTGDARAVGLATSVGQALIDAWSSVIGVSGSKYTPFFFHWAKGGVAFALHKLAERIPAHSAEFAAAAVEIDEDILGYFPSPSSFTANSLRRGAAGTGFYLARLLDDGTYDAQPEMKARVENALQNIIDGLLSNAVRVDEQKIKWFLLGRSGDEHPGYSYGTAGIVHFLCSMYKRTHNATLLEYAVQGGAYVGSVVDTSTGEWLPPYAVPADRTVRSYFGECHGNSGYIRALVSLAEVTGDSAWLRMADAAAVTLITRTTKHQPMFNFWLAQTESQTFFWDNLSICDGNCAAIEALSLLRRHSASRDYDAAIATYTENIQERATIDASRGWASWNEAEWRTNPKAYSQQVGMYIGASGVAQTLMLQEDPMLRIALPDFTFPLK